MDQRIHMQYIGLTLIATNLQRNSQKKEIEFTREFRSLMEFLKEKKRQFTFLLNTTHLSVRLCLSVWPLIHTYSISGRS